MSVGCECIGKIGNLQGLITLMFIYFIYLLNFAHTYMYIFLLLKSRLIKIRARDLLETIKGF